MKKVIISTILFFVVYFVFSQSEAVTPIGTISITPEVKPPIFVMVGEPFFEEPSGNNAIDANENCSINITVKNEGLGDGMGLRAEISAVGTTNALEFDHFSLPTIKVGETKTVKFPISAGQNTVNGTANFSFKIAEPNGFGTQEYKMTIATLEFVQPMLKLTDYTVTSDKSGNLQKLSLFDLQILVQNTQHGLAEDVEIALQIPDGVFLLGGNSQVESFPTMKAGEAKSLVYSLIVNQDFASLQIPIDIKIKEKYGKYSENGHIELTLNQVLAQSKIKIAPVIEKSSNIEIASLRSDVDKNIPEINSTNQNRFALVFGNEDYHSSQIGMSTDSDVPYAVNDATVFAEYCIKTLGVPANNVFLRINSGSAEMKREITRISKLLKVKGENSELIFYYAGHGLPDGQTREPYFVPIDVSGAEIAVSGIKTTDVYKEFAASGASKITVFIDACFSGGGNNALIGARAVSIKPKDVALFGNIVVFSATTEPQTAHHYDEKQHGLFTYFLLKKLQNSPSSTYGELSTYIKSNVTEVSLRSGYEQIPMVNVSLSVLRSWETWKF